MERLDSILSGAGYSRVEARALIAQGRVTVDGVTVTDPERKVPPDAAVAVDAAALERGHVTLMLHKPAGVISATVDRREKTVLDLLPDPLRRRGLFPVGRLDKNTTGLLFLTNDGALAHALTSPRHHAEKTYRVTVDKPLDETDRVALAGGLTLADGTVCRGAELAFTDRPEVGLLTLREGKYHQVKRMMACLGKPVTALKRVSMGGVALDETLAPGQWRALTPGERATLEAGEFS